MISVNVNVEEKELEAALESEASFSSFCNQTALNLMFALMRNLILQRKEGGEER